MFPGFPKSPSNVAFYKPIHSTGTTMERNLWKENVAASSVRVSRSQHDSDLLRICSIFSVCALSLLRLSVLAGWCIDSTREFISSKRLDSLLPCASAMMTSLSFCLSFSETSLSSLVLSSSFAFESSIAFSCSANFALPSHCAALFFYNVKPLQNV